jgi:hypothetical protein
VATPAPVAAAPAAASPSAAALPTLVTTWIAPARGAGRLSVALRLDARRHRATAYAYARFALAPMTLALERRRCRRGRCAWTPAARVRSTTGFASLTRRLATGRYRVTVRASGSRSARRSFRLR